MTLNYSDKGDMEAHSLMIYTIVRGIKPDAILEIGIRGGVSTLTICQALQDGDIKTKYHCCDINASALNVQRKTNVPLTFHIMSSNKLAEKWDQSIDLLFIDGCHEYSQVKKDYLNFRSFLRPNGFIFFHDTYPPSEKYMTSEYCGDAYRILDDLKKDKTIEFVTFPYSYGLTVCRKLS